MLRLNAHNNMKNFSWSKIILVIGILYASLVLWFFPKWTVDDAYITFRYAHNLAEHGALTWNINENPIEGYTGFLLPTLLAVGLEFGFDPSVFSQVIGVLGLSGTVLSLWLIFRQMNFAHIVRSALILFFLSLPFLYTNTLSGLETMLFIGLFTFSLYLFLKTLTQPKFNHLTQLFIVLLLVSLCRPEGALWAIIVSLSTILFFRKDKILLKQIVLAGSIFYALPAIIYFGWRSNYYEYLLPNTFYAKSRGGFYLNHLKDFTHFAVLYFAPAAIFSVFLILSNPDKIWTEFKKESSSRLIQWFVFALLIFISLTLLQYSRSALKMNFSYRFFVPLIPIILVLIGILIERGFRELKNRKTIEPLRVIVVIGLMSILGAYHFLTITHRLKDERRFAAEYQNHLKNQHIAVGKYLAETLPAGSRLAMLYDAGAVPYYSQLPAIDMGGLNDEYIAHNKPSQAELIEYFFAQNPAVAVFTSYEADRVVHDPMAEAILVDSRFKEYKLMAVAPTPPNSLQSYSLFVYAKTELVKNSEPIVISQK